MHIEHTVAEWQRVPGLHKGTRNTAARLPASAPPTDNTTYTAMSICSRRVSMYASECSRPCFRSFVMTTCPTSWPARCWLAASAAVSITLHDASERRLSRGEKHQPKCVQPADEKGCLRAPLNESWNQSRSCLNASTEARGWFPRCSW